MNFLIGAIKVIFLLGFLILIHESGHFCVAKLCKVKAKQFAIGFGPKIFSKQGEYTKYSVRAIPLGGYVELLGETEQVDEEGSFNKAKISSRLAIVAAGATVNIIFGLVVYFVLMTSSGVNSTTTIKNIIPEYMNSDTVLQSGDQVLEINGQRTRIKSDIDNILLQSNGEDMTVLVQRNGQNIELTVKPTVIVYGDFTRYILGVEVEQAEKNLRNNLYYGFWETEGFVYQTVSGLKQLFTGKAQIKQITGPIGISGMVAKNKGIYNYIYLLAVISLSLGITNLLPIPALDGGKIVLLFIEAIRRKPLDQELELKIQSLGFSLLILLSLYVSVNDVINLF